MKIGIHHRSGSFSDRWIAYCEEFQIPYKIVDCYHNTIVDQLADCDGLMWHYHHGDYRDMLFAKSLLFSIESSGKKVFPNFHTAWHFDDKVAQKYLLEATNSQLVPSFCFYTKKQALRWAKTTSFPKVFKLKGGAGASNVKLIKSESEARRIISKCFGRGFSQFNKAEYFNDQFNKWREKKSTALDVLKAGARFFISTEFAKMSSREKGYAYFQEFIPNNDSDIRIIVIGNKAFGLKRMIRKNDFRASGSGNIIYSKNEIDERCVEIAFKTNRELKSQCIAYDFVFDQNQKPLIVEISFGFSVEAYDSCPGYWTDDLKWIEGNFNPQFWMIENFINTIHEK